MFTSTRPTATDATLAMIPVATSWSSLVNSVKKGVVVVVVDVVVVDVVVVVDSVRLSTHDAGRAAVHAAGWADTIHTEGRFEEAGRTSYSAAPSPGSL